MLSLDLVDLLRNIILIILMSPSTQARVKGDMDTRVREDIRVWVDAQEWGAYDMEDAVGQLREAVSKEGVKSAAVTRIGRDLLRKMERCLDLLEDGDDKTKLADHHVSLGRLVRRQGHEDYTDEVGCLI